MMIWRFFVDYSWLLITLVLAIIFAVATFGFVFISDIINKFADRDWWADNVLAFVVFTALVGTVMNLQQNARERRRRTQYEGWKLLMRDHDGDEHTQEMFWQEVERFLDSAFERWKFVKSLSSGAYWINLPTIDKAEQEESRWITVSRPDKIVTVDFQHAIEVGHATQSKSRNQPS